MTGRGRGEGPEPTIQEEPAKAPPIIVGELPVLTVADRRSSSDSGGESEPAIRGRGGYRAGDLRTIPAGISVVKADATAKGQSVDIMGNFVRISPMKERDFFQYRVDFTPDIEAVSLKRRLFQMAINGVIAKEDMVYDGVSDARSSRVLPQNPFEKTFDHPVDAGVKVKVTIRKVGKILWSSYEMLRLYNMNMKKFLRELKFFQVSTTGAFVHPNFSQMIANNTLAIIRGFRTACNIHEQSQIMINLESVHKLVQFSNVLQEIGKIINQAGRARSNAHEAVKQQLIGKLVVPKYNKRTYRIEDINFNLSPESTFPDKQTNKEIKYFDYFKNRYNESIKDRSQPLLLVTDNTKRREQEGGDQGKDIYLVPELCNIAGLTDEQRNDNRLKMDLIKASQVPPNDRVTQAKEFLRLLHDNQVIKSNLESWGYSIDNNLVTLKGRIIPTESIGLGTTANLPMHQWSKVDQMGGFDKYLEKEKLAVTPPIANLAIVVSKTDAQCSGQVMGRLKMGVDKVGLAPSNVQQVRITEGDTAHLFCSYIRNLPPDTTAAIVIMPRQNKERYDAIKKVASVERGLITQVVTSRLMCDERKGGSAAVKIGIQIAAKVGGEPWHIYSPLGGVMVCGYDTYHDTSNRGRSFGAFIASTNRKLSRWYSKADTHDKLDELSANMAENMGHAIRNYQKINQKYPERIILYRDGVSDGQLEHVYKVELSKLRKVVEGIDKSIRLTMIVVNKRVGARFYMRGGNGVINPPPGTVIDDTVTRESRYDFYLVSQSTRHGTINPTYYNIIYDQSGLSPDKHQMLAFKLCFLYYNWSGTVRVPAPCQYAHKLAYLCGEHLHAIPNATLNDRLHFL